MSAEQWESVHRKLAALELSARVVNAIARGYRQGWLKKPLEELTDDDLLSLRNFGPAALYEFRQIVNGREAYTSPLRELIWKVPTDKGDFWFTVRSNWPQNKSLAAVIFSCAMSHLTIDGFFPMKRAPATSEYSVVIEQRGTGRLYMVLGGKRFWAAAGRVAEFEALQILTESDVPPVIQRRGVVSEARFHREF